MNRFTIPDEPIEGGTRRRVIDARAVRQEAMTIYWLLKEYEDTGMEPEEIKELLNSYNAVCKALGVMKKEMAIDKLEELCDQIQRVEHDQMAANGVQRAIEVINNMQDDKISDEEEDMDELDMLRSENEELRMRLAEIRERVNGMELPHEYHILYTRGWHDAVEEVRRYID